MNCNKLILDEVFTYLKKLMQNYSGIQKFLHDFVLSKKFINKSLFEFEKIIYLKDKDISNQSHIFITGLPRSGTTSILNFIFSSNCKYRNGYWAYTNSRNSITFL